MNMSKTAGHEVRRHRPGLHQTKEGEEAEDEACAYSDAPLDDRICRYADLP